MKKRSKLLVVVMIFAFALTGIAYAAWTDSLQIEGTVGTGTIDAQFISVKTNDSGNTKDPGTNPGRHVATTEADIDITNSLLTVTTTDAYPGYKADIIYELKNEGTVPVKVTSVTIPTVEGLTLDHPNLVGLVLDGDEKHEVTLKQIVNDDAVQNTTYEYDIKIDFKQWNL